LTHALAERIGGAQEVRTVAKRQGGKVPVTMRALIQRINRKLAAQGEKLKTYRGGRSEVQLGRYYIIDVRRNFLVAGNQDPEGLGRELGVLKEWEKVEQ